MSHIIHRNVKQRQIILDILNFKGHEIRGHTDEKNFENVDGKEKISSNYVVSHLIRSMLEIHFPISTFFGS